MAIAAKPKRPLSADPMAFITGAEIPDAEAPEKKRKEPVIIRFDEVTLKRVDQARQIHRALKPRAELLPLLAEEEAPDGRDHERAGDDLEEHRHGRAYANSTNGGGQRCARLTRPRPARLA